MKWSLEQKIPAGFTLTLVFLLVIGAIAYRSATRSIDTYKWVDHTREVLYRLERVSVAVLSRLNLRSKTGMGYLTATLKGDWDANWSVAGLGNVTIKNKRVTMPVLLTFDANPPVLFGGRRGSGCGVAQWEDRIGAV